MPYLEAGGRLKMKYFFPDRGYWEDTRETAIKDICRDEQGRFNGHYLLALELV
ncbi:MAG: hypothetical protein P8175_07025 [Deltaproteobacteria bacterium]